MTSPHDSAALAQEEPRLARGEGCLELGNVRVVEADARECGLRGKGEGGGARPISAEADSGLRGVGRASRTEICSASVGTVESNGTSPVYRSYENAVTSTKG